MLIASLALGAFGVALMVMSLLTLVVAPDPNIPGVRKTVLYLALIGLWFVAVSGTVMLLI